MGPVSLAPSNRELARDLRCRNGHAYSPWGARTDPAQLCAQSRPCWGGQSLTAHPIEKGEFYGVSQASEIPSRSLSATDVDGLEMKPAEFRLHLRNHLGLKGTTTDLGDGLLDLGALEVGDKQIRLIYALRQPSVGSGDRIRAKSTEAYRVRYCFLQQLMQGPTWSLLYFTKQSLHGRTWIRTVVAAHGLGNTVPAIYTAPEGSRLVIDSRLGKAWVDEVEITDLPAGTHRFRLVEVLAKACPEAVSTEWLKRELSGARQDGDTAARQAKTAALKAIKQAMADAGLSFS